MDIINLITNVGFPIVCCYLMFTHMTKTEEKNMEKFENINKELINLVEKTTKAIENNSNALDNLKDYIQTVHNKEDKKIE